MTFATRATLPFTMALAALLFASTGHAFKDTGPKGACDRFESTDARWTACVGAAKSEMPDEELFYAGYWLARTGRYAEALGYLQLAKSKDARTLTYIGFATRKLGDVDGALPLYNEALRLNPDYSVARAYLGEAYLTKGEPEKAKDQLAEIEQRCGKACAEYADLSQHITAFEKAQPVKG